MTTRHRTKRKSPSKASRAAYFEKIMFEKLRDHWSHAVEITLYGDLNDPVNVAIECTDCEEVLLDFDNPRMKP